MADDEQTDSQAEPAGPPTSRNRKVVLGNLYLDPNNYRFIEQPDYVLVPEDAIADPDVQRRTTAFLLGKNAQDVGDLVASFKKHGWLPVDQIQVRELSRGKYVVVEGNRRVATLKHLERRFQDSAIDLGSLDPKLFGAIPVVLYDSEDSAHHKVIMGLGHITGKKRWPPINQARLLQSLLTDDGWNEDEVCKAIGISRHELRSTLKTLALCDLYRSSDYGEQFTAEKYSLFREVIRSRDLSRWIGWNDAANRPDIQVNVDRLFCWLSREDAPLSEDGPEAPMPLDPVINTSTDVRELSKIVNDENALRILDETRLLSDARASSEVLVQDRLSDGLRRINESIGTLFNYATKLTEEQLGQAQTALKKLQGVFAVRDRQPSLLGERLERRPFNLHRQSHFSELRILQFRRFSDLQVSGLKRVNLFAGPNNSGKTTLLEAVDLLASQNDIDELLRVICRRGKLDGDPPALWISEQIEPEVRLAGRFDALSDNVAEVTIRNEQNGDDLDDKTFYVTSLEVEAKYGQHEQTAVTHLFQQRERITRLQSVTVLCPVVFSTPFVQHDTEFLVDLFNRSVEAGTKDEVVQFIRGQLDAGFHNVDAAPGHGASQFTRFRVTHDNFELAPDLTQFGEGAQRIFHIGLLFAYARGGVVLIDEFENAIHYSLLRPFTRLVQELAVKFDVQLFLTTHSKECIDAFVKNEYRLEDVSAYAIRTDEGRPVAHHYEGTRLERLLDIADVDLRGGSPDA